MKYEISDCTNACTKVDKIDTSRAGEYEIKYIVNYLGTPYTEIRYVHVKNG